MSLSKAQIHFPQCLFFWLVPCANPFQNNYIPLLFSLRMMMEFMVLSIPCEKSYPILTQAKTVKGDLFSLSFCDANSTV